MSVPESVTPRRSTRPRVPSKRDHPDVETSPTVSPQTRSAKSARTKKSFGLPSNSLEYLLSEPKSKLASVDLAEIINPSTWAMLSVESRSHLASLLPKTSFVSNTPTVDDAHPAMKTTEANIASLAQESFSADPDMLNHDPSFLSCHFLQSAVQAFQEDLRSSNFTPGHVAHMEAYENALRDGTTHAPWKDEEWDLQMDEESIISTSPTKGPSIGKGKGKVKASTKSISRSIELADLASGGYILPGDLISYKRSLSVNKQVIQKDLLVQSYLPSGALLLLLSPSIEESLPFDLLTLAPGELPRITSTSLTPSSASSAQSRRAAPLSFEDLLRNKDTSVAPAPKYLSITTTAPSALETHLIPLFTDTNASTDATPLRNPADAWKAFTVWRWPEGWEHALEEGFINGRGRAAQGKGGREIVGTLFYLRGCYGDLEWAG